MNEPNPEDYFIGKSTITVTVNGEDVERERFEYDWEAYYKARQLKLEDDRRKHKDRLTAAFKKRGIVTANVTFSGGNDDGGVNDITFYDADGNVVEDNTQYHSTHRFIDGQHTEVALTPEEVEDNNFLAIVEAPVSWKWGSWAGDFNAMGVLRYNIGNTKPCSACNGGCDKCNNTGEIPNDGYYVMEYEESSYDYYTEEG